MPQQVTQLPERFRPVVVSTAILGAAAAAGLSLWDVYVVGWSRATTAALLGAALLCFTAWKIATRRMIPPDFADRSQEALERVRDSRWYRAAGYLTGAILLYDFFYGDGTMLRSMLIGFGLSLIVPLAMIAYLLLRRESSTR
jgi:hypothetical protein